MQCLYCETELKPLRGLFDEDFCCKEHREKYFSSFRKGINRLPVLDLPPLSPGLQSGAEEFEEAPQQPELVAKIRQAAEVAVQAKVAVQAEEAEPVKVAPPTEEPAVIAASIAPVLEAVEAVAAPPMADFRNFHIAPSGAADCYFMVDEKSFPACKGPAIPDVEVFCDAAFEPEDGLAHLIAPANMRVAGRAANLEPHLGEQRHLSASLRAWEYAPSTVWMAEADPIEDVEMAVAGAVSRGMARHTDSYPFAWPTALMTVPAFQIFHAENAQPGLTGAAEVGISCLDAEGEPLMFSDLAPVMEIHSPAFQVSSAVMQMDEELKRAIEPPKTEAVRLAEPEIARPAVMSAAPASHGVSGAPFQPAMPAVRAEAQLNVPAMSSRTDAVPGVAREAVPDPPRGATADQPPVAHSSEPVQPAIQNSARIKNWRLKITFAKPA